MAGIFICYRRADAEGWAGRLSDSFKGELGRVNIFRDIEDIPPGVEFDSYINEAVGSCDVLIALIGPHWLTVKDKNGVRRIDDPKDFTRLEIVTALKRNVRVIPALVGGAQTPDIDELPDELKPLARRQSYELSDTRWVDDCRKLADVLRPITKQESWLGTKAVKAILVSLLVLVTLVYGGTLWYDHKEEADRIAKEEADRETKEEKDRIAKEEADRKAKEEEAARKAKLEAERMAAAEAAKLEAERKAREEEAARIAKLEAEREAKAEAARIAKLEAEREDKAEAARIAKLEAEREAKAEAARIAKLEAERMAREEAAAKAAAIAKRARSLQKNYFYLPGDGTQNNNNAIGPFCCTGETAVIYNANKSRVGYIYFSDFKGGFNIGSSSSGAASLGILVSGLASLTDSTSGQQESSIWFSAKELKRGMTRSTSAGGLHFKATILQAELGFNKTNNSAYYVMGSVKVKVDVSVVK